MSLRLKINLVVGLLTLLFTATVLGLQINSMRESVHEEVEAANRVASQLLNRTALRYAAQGTPAMLAFLQGVGRIRSNDIKLIDQEGHELYRSPPSPYKAGRDAPAWFERVIAPPPSMQSIAFPDGKLIVQANASRAAIDAWDYSVVLASGSVVLLLLVNGLIFWIVGRTVRPFAQIVGALNALEAGRFDTALPKLPGTEAAAIGAAFNRMVGVLHEHIETERRAVRAEGQLSDSRELSRWIDQHIEQERRMIARELHDELGQSVTAMRSMALSIAQRVHGHDAQAETAARLIAEESSRLYDAMHGLIPRLTPLVLDNFGLAEALDDLVERTRRAQVGVKIELQVALPQSRLAGDAALALYRAAQEGITNALRHGGARVLRVSLQTSEDRLFLEVTDDGSGLKADAPSQTGHYGLRWLSERVAALGGDVSLEAAAAGGAQLQVWLPLARNLEAAEGDASGAPLPTGVATDQLPALPAASMQTASPSTRQAA